MLSADHEVVSSNPNLSSSQTFFHCFGDQAGTYKTKKMAAPKMAAPNDLLELALPAELTDT